MAEFDESDYRVARADHLGWCAACEDWARDCTEPDAEHYDCPECGQNDVIGADLYLLRYAE